MDFYDDILQQHALQETDVTLESAKNDPKNATSQSLDAFYSVNDQNAAIWSCNHAILEFEAKWFDRGYAKLIGDKANVTGFCMIYIWSTSKFNEENPKATQPDAIFKYRLPTRFDTIPSDIETTTRSINNNPTKMIQLHYHKGSTFMSSVEVAKDKMNSVAFVNSVFNNDICPLVRTFGEFTFLFTENAKLNGLNYGLNASRFDMIESVLTRSAADPTKPYRLHRDGGMIGARIDDLPALTNTFMAASFRDPVTSGTRSILRARSGEEETIISPIEESMYY